MNDYKRQKILNKHLALQEKIDKRKRNIHMVQNCAISKNMSDQEASSLITKLLEKMKTENPNDPGQRERLMRTMSSLNAKYDLGLTLNYNKYSSPPKKDPEQ
eukprot:TRINITY_DN2411_c0_g1_i4.p2 TRINITY_DN2411_c0_g1~~TRINITY_DN2411_c0_g1_i4.p2  ORF type:complete len:102 (+),score=30.78 TRINITY_DN2411_c0_g1_i4:316-621(+)